jgi:hypothetical protein
MLDKHWLQIDKLEKAPGEKSHEDFLKFNIWSLIRGEKEKKKEEPTSKSHQRKDSQ